MSCESIQEMSQILLMLNEKFSSCESLSKIISSVVVEKPKEEAKGYNEDDDEFFYDDEMNINNNKKEEDNIQIHEEDEEGLKFKKMACIKKKLNE